MDKTININISGILFQIDKDAFGKLRDYLQAINNRFRNTRGGTETIEDIESRIAEIFQSQKGLAGAITQDNVDSMISIIGKPEDFDIHEEEQTEHAVYSATRKRLYRNPDDSIISGVCGGIGAYLNMDPVIIRILFVIFTVFFGIGFFVYVALWISLPPANSDSRKRELHGNTGYSTGSQNLSSDGTAASGSSSYVHDYRNSSRLGNAINEIFSAIGRLFFIVLRIFLIILGATLVLTGFLFILCFVMILVFKYPGSYSDGFNMNLTYLVDFLKYVVNPVLVPWIIALTTIALILPMLALIYWGIKMIFWFRARDGVVSLIAIIVWVISLATLAIILFNEGISFADIGKSSEQTVLAQPTDTLYIRAANKISGLKYDKELSFSEKGYTVFINEDKKELYIRPYLKVFGSEKGFASVELRKRSSGRDEFDAMKKTEGLLYSYKVKSDTLHLDEYFTIPAGRKWAADNVGINLYLPVGTFLKMDGASEKLLHLNTCRENEMYYDSSSLSSDGRTWVLTNDGLEPVIKPYAGKK